MLEQLLHSDQVTLYKPLVIDPERFIRAYNIDITDFVINNSYRESAQKGKKEILYLPYAKAIELKNVHFPELAADCVVNPLTGGYAFEEVNSSGFFMRAYMHNGVERSPLFYYGVLDTVGKNIYPSSLISAQQKLKTEGKEYDATHLQGNAQEFNKQYLRALTKAIALVTGIGLKLWTGEDLSDEALQQRISMIEKVKSLHEEYVATGKTYELPVLTLASTVSEIRAQGSNLTRLLKEGKAVG